MQGSSVEGRGQSGHLVQKDTQGPYIRLKAVAFRFDDLGGQVVRSSYDSLCLGASVGENARDSKITELHDALLSAENVLTLKISMQNFLVVAMLNSQSDLSEPVEKFIFSHVVLLS